MIESCGRRQGRTAFRRVHSRRLFGLLGIVAHTGSGSIGGYCKTYLKAGPPWMLARTCQLRSMVSPSGVRIGAHLSMSLRTSIHGYWMVDWDQPDCKPWHEEFHDAVSLRFLPFVRYGLAHTSQGCTSYRSGKRRIEAHLVGINNRKEQDWWLLCSTTPLVWNRITYTSPTHCESRVSCFPFEHFTSGTDPCP